MSAPPTNLSAADLWTAITVRPRPNRLVEFPRRDPVTNESIGNVAMWVLTPNEHAQASAAAEKYTKTMLGETSPDHRSLSYPTVYDNAASVEILARCCRAESDLTRTAFPSPQAIREVLTTDEVAVLISAYLQFRAEVGPIVSDMTELEMEAWISRLEEGGRVVAPFFTLSPAQKLDLFQFMANRLRTVRMGNSSPGTHPDVPTFETPPQFGKESET